MKKENISFIGFLTCYIIYFIGSILNFMDKDNDTTLIFLCLATTHFDKKKKNSSQLQFLVLLSIHNNESNELC